MTCLFIFRRDLRTDDNTGLINALKDYGQVIPLFILTPKQTASNPLKSCAAIQFMVESLLDLETQVKIWIACDDEITAITQVYQTKQFDAIYVNDDYTPYSISRDKRIASWCRSRDIIFRAFTDILLIDDNDVRAKNGNLYYNFSLFYNKATQLGVREPMANRRKNYVPRTGMFKQTVTQMIQGLDWRDLIIKGGTKAGNRLLKTIDYKGYNKHKDLLAYETTLLSAHNHFGTISIRRIYEAFKADKSGELIRKLYWRDYYYFLSKHDPRYYTYEHLTKKTKKYRLWDDDKTLLKLWQSGQTGFPVVDAAMRQMNAIGWMPNRARMIVAEFLTKILIINWKYGERYFTTQLIDIDRAQNMGNWNWSSSFGLDASPYLRIMNPWSQSQKCDPDCVYIKTWVPELRDVPSNHIHKWYKYHDQYDVYREPCVPYAERRKIFEARYKKAFSN